ncbi:MAG TPA: PrsW family glutamic-type intramembrane protease [Usitatibacter sp.]|jgi:RsiW-degrading membrane proteinase PrsW (M82 family)|nr:PrsW family glutamic-type intramembrane protease [Usitatibacter sp.]
MLAVLMGLAPVTTFLVALVLLDSYKLVKLRAVALAVACGMAAAGIAYLVNGLILGGTATDFIAYTRYGAPFLEELLKGLVIVAFIRTHRVGFLVDAAILGFGVGAGFAMVENLVYLEQIPDAVMGTWVVRGFGTAIMHGGATAIFAMAGLAMLDRRQGSGVDARAFVPGYVIAVVLHSAFNHFFLSPRLSTFGVAIVVPALLFVVFDRSGKAVGRWLGTGFDADSEMLELINSGRLSDSPVGRYLHTLKDRFQGVVVADILCYVRVYTELALRAKGLLMMRENGFNPPADESTREKFAELRYLETSIGKTGLLAIQPMLHMSHKDLWQLHMLGR